MPEQANPKESNGGAETQLSTEAHTETTYQHGQYVLEDFSQQKINRGQQKINYLIKDVDEKIVVALRELRFVIAKLDDKVDLRLLDKAIDDVAAATNKVAGPFPPGCQDPPTKPGSDG